MALIIFLHQLVFQGMFFAKNITLGRKLGKRIRGFNLEASLSIGFFMVFIGLSLFFALSDSAPGRHSLLPGSVALASGVLLLVVNVLLGMASLRDLGDSWRVGVIREQATELVETGIYRHSRNPYFVAYLLMFAAYTVLLQNLILLGLSLVGLGMVHAMIRKEEKYLAGLHGEAYRDYTQRVPRYLFL